NFVTGTTRSGFTQLWGTPAPGLSCWKRRSLATLLEGFPGAVPCDHLHLVLPDTGSIKSTSVTEARDRLGVAPLQRLFELLAEHEAVRRSPAEVWRGLQLFGLDGTIFPVPDSPENRRFFGSPSSGTRGEGAYPQCRLVALMHLGSHLLRAVRLGTYQQSELSLADELFPVLPEQSLLIMDRGFACWRRLFEFSQHPGRFWLLRGKKNLTWQVVHTHRASDLEVDVNFSPPARKVNPGLPATMRVRVIFYRRPGFSRQYLITSLLDPLRYPARELVKLYHQRWEVELGFDELKTHTLEREEALRSRSPERIQQELYGLLIVYNLVRSKMVKIAQRLDVSPLRVSYRLALLLMRNFWLSAWVVAAGRVPQQLEHLTADLELLLLPERRRRHQPRVVKVKMSNYRKKPRPSPA
ncbi:IS4 family transposase, partial [Deinococcus sp. SDU3-2]